MHIHIVITFVCGRSVGEQFKTKNHKPKVEMQERIINPPIGEKNRESNHIFIWEKYGWNGGE